MHLISQIDLSKAIQCRTQHTCVQFRYSTAVATFTSATNKNVQILLRGLRSNTNSGLSGSGHVLQQWTVGRLLSNELENIWKEEAVT